METISLKLDSAMLKTMDQALKENNYGTRTEFIREAIRDKLDSLSRRELVQMLLATKGVTKKDLSSEELGFIREKIFEELR